MKHFLKICLLFPFFLNAQKYTAIQNVNVIDIVKGELIRNQTVLIKDSIIESIGEKITIPLGAKRIKAKGKYLIPGLIDTHLHLFSFFHPKFIERRGGKVQAALNFMIAFGITGFREASSSIVAEEMIYLRDSIESGEKLGPKMYVSAIATGTNLKKYKFSNYTQLVTRFKEMGVDGIKVKFTTYKETKEIIDQAHKLNLTVFGHTASKDSLSKNILGDFTYEIIEYGIDGVMHVSGYPQVGNSKLPQQPADGDSNGWWFYEDALWLFVDSLAENNLVKKMIEQKTWLEPTLATDEVQLLKERIDKENIKYLLATYEDLTAYWPKQSRGQIDTAELAFKRRQSFVKKFYDAGGLVLAGTDFIFGASIHRELELLVDAGLTPAAALKVATYNNAKALGWLNQLGTIENNKLANLVLLDKNPLEKIKNSRLINAVILKGRFFNKNELKQLIKEGEMIIAGKRNDVAPFKK